MKRFLFLFVLTAALGVQAQTAVRYNRAELAWIHFLDPVADAGGQSVSGTVMLADGQSNSGKQFFETIADDIQRQVGRFPAQRVGTVDIISYDTPSGSSRSSRSSRGNSRSGRGNSRGSSRSSINLGGLKEVLMERFGAENVALTVVPEDWESILRITQEQPDIRLKQAALDIMRHVGVQQGREQQLKALAGGETWRQLQQQVFPLVRRVEYNVSLMTMPVDGTAVTLDGLYATAGGLQKGSNDYYDIIDLAARLFPGSVEAVVNAAGVALLRGDVQRAADYLQPLQKDPRASLHLGVMYLLRGDATRAEVHLRLAETMGLTEATAALRALHDVGSFLNE